MLKMMPVVRCRSASAFLLGGRGAAVFFESVRSVARRAQPRHIEQSCAELAAADARDWNPDFILKSWIVFHLQRAILDATSRLCPGLARNIEAYPPSLPILLNPQEGRV